MKYYVVDSINAEECHGRNYWRTGDQGHQCCRLCAVIERVAYERKVSFDQYWYLGFGYTKVV